MGTNAKPPNGTSGSWTWKAKYTFKSRTPSKTICVNNQLALLGSGDGCFQVFSLLDGTEKAQLCGLLSGRGYMILAAGQTLITPLACDRLCSVPLAAYFADDFKVKPSSTPPKICYTAEFEVPGGFD